MPELPDIEVFSANLNSIFAGKKVAKVKVVNGNKLKDKPKDIITNVQGKTLKRIFRSGKEMRFEFTDGSLLGMHLMLTGDVFVFDKENDHNSTIIEFHFNNGKGLALTDRMKNANVKLNPEDKEGVDALAKALNFKYLKKILDRKAQIKNVLLDQDLIRGIGNAYSDEILWETKISPFSVSSAIPDDKIKELAKTIKKVLKNATAKINKNYPGRIQGEVRDFLNIHTKKKDKSPTGAPIKMEKRGMLKTFYTDEQKWYN
ncbi:Fpg/Nei family DNA glycosylase [Ginsengibacter hankyongi]|uniref:Fpg/Nei family DNA glycosylase n=1 Tax=Ginsengibacter hankyongi TaxID=2607284 RepID=A0A5J5IEV0_9BACT|nr:DNA-formamidopyrimidine glycosylase family protein [Ginsengibacter hankyongi]KAA9037147.1 Fpg/Nei family DNA glycosylase [Ginsengibacter hankyongi]